MGNKSANPVSLSRTNMTALNVLMVGGFNDYHQISIENMDTLNTRDSMDFPLQESSLLKEIPHVIDVFVGEHCTFFLCGMHALT
jgi:hypothetical protein